MSPGCAIAQPDDYFKRLFPECQRKGQRMNAELKSRIKKIFFGFIAFIISACWLHGCMEEKDATEAAEKFRKEVNGSISSAHQEVENRPAGSVDFNIDGLVLELTGIKEQLKKNEEKAKELANYVQESNREPQPKHVIDACQARLEQIQRINEEQEVLKTKAEQLYTAALEDWIKLSDIIAAATKRLAHMRELYKTLSDKLKIAEQRRAKTKPDWEARRIYRQIIRRIKRVQKLMDAEMAFAEQWLTSSTGEHSRVMNKNKEVDYNKPDMKKISDLRDEILRWELHSTNIPLPSLKPAPPPPVFKPDMVLASTGDLPEALLMPLVEQWLLDNKAHPLEGNSFVWEPGKNGSKELEVSAPANLQGAEAGKLRIRVLPAAEKEAAFAELCTQGGAQLLLTGQIPSEEMIKAWLPEGKSLQAMDESTQGRSYRARVCYDALVFFRGVQFDMSTVRSASLRDCSKVFSVNDRARAEAITICGLEQSGTDVAETQRKTMGQLCTDYGDKMVLGVWHKDAAGNVSVNNVPTICYAAGWESEEAQKNIPDEYRAGKDGVPPTAENIASGRYAYSYSIYFYRNARNTTTRGSELARNFMLYAADAENSRVETLIRTRGFVPVKLGLDKLCRSNRLTKDDLPLPVLFKKMGAVTEEFGYDASESQWVYGVRIPMPLYYETGSAEASEDGVSLDPDAAYYTSTQAFARIREAVGNEKAIVLVLGHADPQWNKKLMVDSNSWKQNLKLSEKRAGIVGKKKVQSQMEGSNNIRHIELGSGWARPACDISLARSVVEQQNVLARCRRVEVFIIFPVPGVDGNR